MKTKNIIMTIGLSALAFAGCESTTPNSNVTVKTTNSNQAVVVNNNSNVPATNTTPRRDNSNISKEEYNKNKADYEKNKSSTETIGQGLSDSYIWFKTKAALALVDDLRDSTINVDVVNDIVTLKGTVASAAEKTKAETTAKGIEGVKSVKNELKVEPKDSLPNQAVNGSSTPAKTTPTANKK